MSSYSVVLNHSVILVVPRLGTVSRGGGLTNAEWRRIIACLDLLAEFLLEQLRMLLAFVAAVVCCWLIFGL